MKMAIFTDGIPTYARIATFQSIKESADNLHLDYRVYEVREAGDIDAAFVRLGPDKIQAIFIPGSPTFNNNRKRIAEKIAVALSASA
jgi:hypothetical protein